MKIENVDKLCMFRFLIYFISKGGMLAIINDRNDEIEEVFSTQKLLYPNLVADLAVVNSHKQVVYSGDFELLEKVTD